MNLEPVDEVFEFAHAAFARTAVDGEQILIKLESVLRKMVEFCKALDRNPEVSEWRASAAFFIQYVEVD